MPGDKVWLRLAPDGSRSGDGCRSTWLSVARYLLAPLHPSWRTSTFSFRHGEMGVDHHGYVVFFRRPRFAE